MAAAKRRRYDDDDFFDASIKQRGGNRTLLVVGLVVGGLVLATTCTCGLGIGLVVLAFQAKQPDGTQPDEFIGSWKGRFLLHGQQRDVVYTFEKSGKWSEASGWEASWQFLRPLGLPERPNYHQFQRRHFRDR